MSDGFGDFLKEQQDNGTLTAPPPATPAPEQTAQALQAPQEDDSFGSFLKQAKSAAITQNAIAVNSQNASTSPDVAAKAAVLSRQLNMPQAAVETDVPHFENQAKLQKNNEILSKSPVLARWVGDNPDPARIAQDEFDKLSVIERNWAGMKDAGNALSYLGNLGIKGLGGSYNELSKTAGLAIGAIPTLYDKAASILAGKDKTDASDWWFKNFVAPQDAVKPDFAVNQNDSFMGKAAHMVGGLAGTLSQIILTGGTAAPEAAATSVTQAVADAAVHGTKSMAVPATVAAINTAQDVYDKTGDGAQAFKAAQMQYATTTLGGIVPLGAPGNLATRLGTGFVSGLATGEASRQAMNLVLPDQMKQDFNGEDAVLGGLSAALLAGTMGPRAQRNMNDTIRKTYEDAAKSEQAVKAGENIQQLSEIAANSKLRESDPAAFKDFIKRASEDTPLDSVYVDKAKLTEAFNQSGVMPDEIERNMPEVAKQLSDPASSDIRIPVEDYATHIAGSDMDKVLLQELKTDPDGMTMKEGQEHYAKAVEQLQEQAKHIADLHNQDIADATDLQAVHQNILDQLNATGRYKPDVAKVNATIVSEFYAAQAARTGMKPSEFAAQHPLHINAENPVGEKLDQSSLRDQHIWKSTGENANGPMFEAKNFTLDPVKEIPHENDLTSELPLGHVAHIPEGAKPYLFTIRSNDASARSIGTLAASVKDGKIVAIHDIEAQNKTKGLGTDVIAHLAANHNEPIRVIEAIKQAQGFWDKVGANGPDIYGNASYDWQDVARHLERQQRNAETRSNEGSSIEGDASTHGLEARELTEAEIKELEAQGFKFNQPAYHGSPHDFTKFSLDKIGTGEGAQAFGHGLYFAENEGVAKGYHKSLTESLFHTLDGKVFDDRVKLQNPNVRAVLQKTNGNIDSAIARAKEVIEKIPGTQGAEYAAKDIKTLEDLKINGGLSRPKGGVYKVDIPDEHVANFLQWDKPLSEQPESVKKAIQKLVSDHEELGLGADLKQSIADNETGDAFYRLLSRTLGSDKNASRELDKNGIKGIKYLDQGSRDTGDGTHNLVVFDDSIIKLTHKDGTPVSNSERNEYFQSLNQPRDGADNRGAFSPSTNTISLLKSADLSTFAHEAGHFFLETMGKLASAESAHPQIKSDFDAALKWMGVKDADTWNAMSLEQKREFHEKFARGWEQYLMEGKSPNLKMQQIFSRFRAWMISVYRNLRNLNVDLTPEVRQVFDRMIATDASIHEAEQARSFMPLFKDSKEAGVSDKAFADYQQMGQDATDTAVAQMQAKSMKDMQWASNAKAQALKDLQKQHDAARKEVQAQVTKEVMSEPVNKARNWIKNGEMTNDKGELVALSKDAKKASKLNTDAVKSMFPESALDHPDMTKLKGLTGPDGLHPDLMADMFGFRNGDELVRSLIENGDPKDRINAMTDQRMLESHGELVNPDSIEQAANQAVHNEARAKFMASGLKILTKSPLSAREISKAAKEVADKMIAEKRVRDLNERQYLSAETKANKEAVSLAAKDPKGAVEAQRTALLNNRLAKSAANAITEVQKGVDYLKKFDKESIRNKIDLEYRDQIDALLDRYDLRQSVSNKALDKRESLSNFVERQASLGLQTDIPQKLLDEANRMHYKDMPVEDFRGLVDSVKMIENLGRLKDKLLEAKHQRDLQTAADEAVKVMSGLKQHDFDNNRGLSRLEVKFSDAKAFGRSLTTSLLKMEQVMDWLDRRDPNGPMNTYVFRPIADAGVKANDMMVKMKAGIDELVHKNLEDITKDKGKIYTSDKLIDSKTGKPLELTKKEMLDMAGHLGNESSWDKLLRGEKWDDQAARDFLMANMRKGDWDYVAGIGKALESLWPAKLEMNRRLGISDAEKIQPRAFDTEHGSYEGWYWPMKYDPARSAHVADRSSMNSEAIFESLFTRESLDTDTGRMNTRNENYAAPVLLNIDSLPRIIADEIHDTAYREAVINAHEFVTHPDVRKAIVSAMSQQHYDQIRPWLVSIANDGRLDTSNMRAMKWMDSMAHQARIRATMVGLGFRLSTMLVHGGSAMGESVAELGPKWMASGLKDFSNPTQWAANKDFIFERSGEMRNRMNEVDRDVREHMREIDLRMSDPATTAIQRGSDFMKAKAYQGIAMLDMASALPTWKGAYNKAMETPEKGGLGMSENDAIYFADKTIRNAHGGTGVKDLAAIQRGPEMMKLFTMFYTFWNHNFNRIADTAKMASELPETYRSGDMQKFKGDASSVILRTLIYTFGVQAMHGLLHPPKEEDAEEGWAKWAGKALVGAFAGGIPVARDIAPYLMGEKDYGVTPAASLVKAVHDSSIDAMHAALGEDVSSKWLKHTINTAGYVFALPTGQPAATTQFLYDLEQGNTNPQDAGDWWRGILTGDTKKH